MPTVPAMPPMENTTRAGTPLATQKAPFQSMARLSEFSPPAAAVALLTDIVPSPWVQVALRMRVRLRRPGFGRLLTFALLRSVRFDDPPPGSVPSQACAIAPAAPDSRGQRPDSRIMRQFAPPIQVNFGKVVWNWIQRRKESNPARPFSP